MTFSVDGAGVAVREVVNAVAAFGLFRRFGKSAPLKRGQGVSDAGFIEAAKKL